jgi:nitrogen fixation NifU-like protein
MEETFYKDLILFHWRNPQNYGKLKKANKRAFLDNPFCGDEISMEAKIEKGKIKEIKFSGKGCIISKASASLITEYVKGKKISEIKNLDKDFILKLLGIELGPTRLKCALLPLNVLKKLIQ